MPINEEKILEFWEKKKIFQKSIAQRKKRPYFSFYDGPPFATGKPHYGHILATTIKDTVLRYWTMKGFFTPRRVGWDCHGLPVENLIEKEMGIKNKREIEQLGIEKFNQACRASVFRCVEDFQDVLKRVGRWADYGHAYATLDNKYIESVWWVLKELWQNNLVYKDYRVSPYCPRCGTPLSNFEVNQGYKEVKDPSVFVKFSIIDPQFQNAYFLVWTTTPWTLPGNLALALNQEADYCLVSSGNENYILAKARLGVLKEEYKIIKDFKGNDLLGLKYRPLFDSISSLKVKNIENAFKVVPADFVSLEDGTGIVHIAPMYGEDDFQVGKKFNLPFWHTVDDAGFFKDEVKEFPKRFVKEADPAIIASLSERGVLYKKEQVLHTYPFCWRCDTPLIYYAIESWYIAVTKFRKNLVKNNKKIHWVPSHIKEGRFGKWLQEAKDWNFSRKRFWGAPLPIWQCNNRECHSFKVIGSMKELEKSGGKKISDLHRPYIDEITFKCEKCGGLMERTPEVFDCWFESGSMPYAQWHYPFENKKLVEETYPADFIAEGLDQTRGWFYTLHVLATALTLKKNDLGQDHPAFKNVIVNGLVLDDQGRKLSKKLKNYPEVKEIFGSYGADALRFFLLASTPIGEDYRFSDQRVKEIWRKIISALENCHIFLKTYNVKKLKVQKIKAKNILDKWIVSRISNLNKEVVQYMDQYELTKAIRPFNDFIEDLSNWYVRRSRQRFQKPKNKKEMEDASQVLHYILFYLSKLMAPFTPFISEYLYQELKSKKDRESVHLIDYPEADSKLINKNLEKKMEKIREIVSLALAERVKLKIKVRQPLAELIIKNPELKKEKELLDLIKEEVNVKKISFGKTLKLDAEITPELKAEGNLREILRNLQEMRKKSGYKAQDKIIVSVFSQGLNELLTKNQKLIVDEGKIKDFKIKEKENEAFDSEKEMEVDGQKIWIGIKKIKGRK